MAVLWGMPTMQYSARRTRLSAHKLFTSCIRRRLLNTWLRLSDVSVICRVTYLQFPIQACFSSTSVSQAAQQRTWFTQCRTSDVAENLGRFLEQSIQARGMTLNSLQWYIWKLYIPYRDHLVVNFRRSIIIAELWRLSRRTLNIFQKFVRFWKNGPLR